MLWGVSEMLNAAVTNISDSVVVEIPPESTAAENLFSAAQHSKFPATHGSF